MVENGNNHLRGIITYYARRPLVDIQRVVGAEASFIDGKSIFCHTLVKSGILLSGRINLHFGFHLILAYLKLVNL